MSSSDMRVSASELLGMALEALERSGHGTKPMHPEDWAAALTPAIDAVAVGYGEGYRRGLRRGREG
jgi:hypothetical protein